VHRVEQRSVHALATPLITKADGAKFGKTESGTIWLDPDLTSPYAFYQFWINADDRDVIGYLKAFTGLSRDALADLDRHTIERPHAREAQRVLAAEVTALVHGLKEARRAAVASQALFGQGELRDLDERMLGCRHGADVHRTGVPGQPAHDRRSAGGQRPRRQQGRCASHGPRRWRIGEQHQGRR
jgi:tyrosyl-tRNA synthetase